MKLASFVVMVACALARVANGEEVEWANTEQTTNLWRVCSLKDIYTLKLLVEEDPSLVTVRSEDGRGPLFWAHEYGFTEGIYHNHLEDFIIFHHFLTPMIFKELSKCS